MYENFPEFLRSTDRVGRIAPAVDAGTSLAQAPGGGRHPADRRALTAALALAVLALPAASFAQGGESKHQLASSAVASHVSDLTPSSEPGGERNSDRSSGITGNVDSPLPEAPVDEPIDEPLESDERAREALMLDVRAYQQAIAELEISEGAFSPKLSEQLLGLGLALQRNGDHPGAIKVFKRGVHLARINEGLYSRRQLALLQGEIASHIAIGAFTEADERQRYLYRVQARTLSDTTRGEALMQHALWQRQAYEAGLGEEPVARLTRMWSLYRLALSEFVDAEGETSPELLPPLYGMLRAQYLLSGFVGEQSNGRFRFTGIYPSEHSSQVAYSNESYKQGSAVIRAIYDVRLAQEGATLVDSIDSMLMLADWKLWHGKRNEAIETYGRLYTELADKDAAKDLIDDVFSRPEPLPNIRGVRALPPPESERDGMLLLEFGVTDRGRVVDLERIDEYPGNDDRAGEIMRRLRQTPFRPRFSDGLPVKTEGIRWAYDTTRW